MDFEAGLRAAQESDFETALKIWTRLAERGNASAKYNLGLMYEDGTGVPQSYETHRESLGPFGIPAGRRLCSGTQRVALGPQGTLSG
jgi:TPR repeat protein